MSFLLGPIRINNNEGIVVAGNSFNVSPTSTSKTVAGSGSFNTGIWVNTNNGLSTSNSNDPDGTDSNIVESF
ncbi:spore germination protein [Litchfieldia alkalitelluris]|uniref:spore germination protein n=1 Tax=Litchfieldia alkalitelluris TaxID=304268 RepID=UPI001115ED32|nr:spore germination protein [Litchfieldia alkalitelluris]